jgi:hypothetical protein
MVAKGEIRRKGRVLKAALARVQDGRPSFECTRCDGVFHTAWVVRYRNGLAAICSFYPDSDPRNDIRVPSAAEWGPPFTLARFRGNLAEQRWYWSLA